MGERRTQPPRTQKAALLAALSAAIALAPTFWFIGVLHFGFVTAPDPTTGQMVRYIVWTSVPGVLLFAFLLHRSVSKRTSRLIGYVRACVVAAAALAPIQAATWIVTLTQWGGDDVVVIGALSLALAAVIFLTESLSEAKPAETVEAVEAVEAD
jgi:hypothetical protein